MFPIKLGAVECRLGMNGLVSKRDERGMMAALTEDNLARSTMKHGDLKSMSTEELWDLHERIVAELSSKMAAERDMLESRLRLLKVADGELKRGKRPYPKVLPKYRNPKNHEETWAGRGKQPRWLLVQLRSGRKLTDFLIR